jgi:diaminopimelate epimerase
VTGLLLKVEGAGNDFVLGTGGWAERLAEDPEIVARLCRRGVGIGADGALAVVVVDDGRVRLTYRNADGSLAGFCANGTRCAARVAVERLGVVDRLVVETGWAPIPARVDGATVSLELPPLSSPPRGLELALESRSWRGRFVEVGVPHLVMMVEDLESLDLARLGPALRHHPALAPDGANVHFVAPRGDSIAVRSFERGVEAETLCCGSGVVAAGLVAMAADGDRRIGVIARSGDELVVEALADPLTGPIRLTGPARIVADLQPTEELLHDS